MKTRLIHVLAAAALTIPSSTALAQASLQSTPAPTVTAENEPWYVSGAPITYGGNVYYPAGAAIHFSRDEMVQNGMFGSTPIYVRTTQEPGSVIYVPLTGGVMRPFERRRTGELAGTVGSTSPSFPVSLQPGQPETVPAAPSAASGGTGPAAAQPMTSAAPPTAPAPAAGTPRPVAVQTRPAKPRVQSVQKPTGVNAVFIEFKGARWYAAGPAVEYSAARYARVGEHNGFPVYQEKGREGVIYLSMLNAGGGLITPYKTR